MDTSEGVKDPPYLRNVGLLITYHCQASCAHCILRAGPDRHEEVSLENARDWIRQIAAYRDHYVYVLSLTGGEPFSNLKLLRSIMEFAADHKFFISIATNGFWAARRDRAKELLQSLPQISFLSVSTDLYHQNFVPFNTIQNVIWACKECGVPFYVSLVTEDTADPGYRQLKSDLVQIAPVESVRTGITFPVGRAADIAEELRYRLRDEPCPEICGAAASPCIFPDGNVYGCIGPLFDLRENQPLYLGNVHRESVADVFDRAETNATLHALRVWGPARILSWLREAGLGHLAPRSFVAGSVCQACHSILANPEVREWLRGLERDPEFRRKIAYARLYHLQESGMLEREPACV